MENSTANTTPTITGIFIQDPEDNGYTAYFAEFPEVIVEGNTTQEAEENLIEAFKIMLEVKRTEMTSDAHHHGKVSSFAYNLNLVA